MLATLLLGYFKTKYANGDDDEQNARIDGYILCAGVVFAYSICGPLFLISGCQYSAQLEKNKQELKKKAKNIRMDSSIEKSDSDQR